MVSVKAIIFDMDGVLSDTQKIHASVESKVLESVGIKILPSEITMRFAGVNDKKMFEAILSENSLDTLLAEKLVKMKKEKYFDELRKNIAEIPGASKLLMNLSKKVPIAIASSSPKHIVEFTLKALGIKRYITAAVGGDEVSNGKPDPEIFLRAAELLKVPPKSCVVVEDGKSGIIAAKTAGMLSIGLGNYVRGMGNYSCETLDEVMDVLNSLL